MPQSEAEVWILFKTIGKLLKVFVKILISDIIKMETHKRDLSNAIVSRFQKACGSGRRVERVCHKLIDVRFPLG
jgi:hypothetical protein